MANEHLLNTADGTTAFSVSIDLSKRSLGGLRPWIPGGAYLADVEDMRLTKKAGGKAGRNISVKLRLVEPALVAGFKIEAVHPAPVGNPEDENDKVWSTGNDFLSQLVASVLDHGGEIDPADVAQTEVDFSVFFDKYGRRVAVRIEDNDFTTKSGKTFRGSQVRRYMTQDEYDGKIGPDDPNATPGAPREVTSTASGVVGGAAGLTSAGALAAGGQVMSSQMAQHQQANALAGQQQAQAQPQGTNPGQLAMGMAGGQQGGQLPLQGQGNGQAQGAMSSPAQGVAALQGIKTL